MDDLAALHQEWQAFEQAYKYHPRYAKEVEKHYVDHLRRILKVQGWTVVPMRSNDHWDLTLWRDGRPVRVEVKIARPRRRKDRDGDYYQFKLKSGGYRAPDGDVVIACCCPNGPSSMVPFIIPIEVLGNRATVEITSAPDHYAGQWSVWRGAWGVLDDFREGYFRGNR